MCSSAGCHRWNPLLSSVNMTSDLSRWSVDDCRDDCRLSEPLRPGFLSTAPVSWAFSVIGWVDVLRPLSILTAKPGITEVLMLGWWNKTQCTSYSLVLNTKQLLTIKHVAYYIHKQKTQLLQQEDIAWNLRSQKRCQKCCHQTGSEHSILNLSTGDWQQNEYTLRVCLGQTSVSFQASSHCHPSQSCWS